MWMWGGKVKIGECLVQKKVICRKGVQTPTVKFNWETVDFGEGEGDSPTGNWEGRLGCTDTRTEGLWVADSMRKRPPVGGNGDWAPTELEDVGGRGLVRVLSEEPGLRLIGEGMAQRETEVEELEEKEPDVDDDDDKLLQVNVVFLDKLRPPD